MCEDIQARGDDVHATRVCEHVAGDDGGMTDVSLGSKNKFHRFKHDDMGIRKYVMRVSEIQHLLQDVSLGSTKVSPQGPEHYKSGTRIGANASPCH